MIDKPDPAKDAGRSDAPGAKRPHATLDLKATEVKPQAATPSAGAPSPAASTEKSASAASSSSEKPASAASASSASASSSSAAAAGAPAGKPSSAADAAAKTSTPNAVPKPAAAPAAKPEPKPAAASGGGFFSHLAAGLIGGALVYAGAAFLGPNWLPGSDESQTAQLAARIAALESGPKNGAGLDALNAKISEAEGRLAKLDELAQNVAALREAQNTLQAETKSLSETAQQGGGASAERIAKLEEQLSLIASGASDASGGTPQLAAISAKISDVEARIADLSKGQGLPEDVGQRLTAAQEASEAAKTATVRLERELSQVRTEQTRGTQRSETTKADTDRLSAAVEAVRSETGRLANTVAELRSSVDSQLKTFAKPADVTAAVNPVNSKLAELEQNVQSVVSNEQSRRQNAERIVLALELSNLKRALDRGQGQGYAAELEDVRKASAGQIDLSALERFKDTGVATPAQLKAEFRPLINAVIDADLEPADGSVIDRLLAGAKSVVRVRKVSHDAGDTSTEAIVARIDTALDEGRLGDVLAQAKALPLKARMPMEDWLIKVTARDTVDKAIAAVEDRLKASLSGAPEADAPAAAPAPVQN
ncbi:hypothetical protein [Hyphomicrobium sp.]|uniref:COG4223 family protein n=1 Tax=Hyphomicrobium sp. TaxID=82 RepID=UPI0025B895E8|nr:hypothetical protein [Hyphomicrobium sp.]MCC7252748.1 hypothetical protein [Hyphomicrobium sp.]